MGWYPAILTASALLGALCAGFILAQSPRERATQLSVSLIGAAAWWSLCEAHWNAAPDAATALWWMRVSTPGWAFIGGILPHTMLRYLDPYPDAEMLRMRRLLRLATAWGYLAGAGVLACATLGSSVHGTPIQVAWGFGYLPGPAMLAFLAALGPPVTLALTSIRAALSSRQSVAPRVHRAAIALGVAVPLLGVLVTDVALPVAGVLFPRFGSTAYTLFGLIAVSTGVRYGLSFFTPPRFAGEILDTLHEGVVMISPQGAIRRTNRGFARLCGRPEDALVGTDLAGVLDWTPPASGEPVENQRGLLRQAGAEQIPVSVSSAPLCDQAGNLIGLVVVVRDLREIEGLRVRMVTQARLAAVGELAAGLAHEINNPLAFVRSNLGQLERHWKELWDAPLSEEVRAIALESREIIAESVSGVDRAAETVRGVKLFVHTGSPVRVPSDLNALLDDAVSMLRPQLQAGTIRLEIAQGEIPPVLCAPQELRQVLLNLLVNAIQATGGAGQPSAATWHRPGEVVIEVRDDGTGIAPRDLERIFDPFFTTKPAGEGTGLGLSIAWQIVEAHGGRIAVESAPGTGSTFRVHLPAA
jgi:signal transduction histidine kinase